jgi:hypothetical protein
MITGSHSTKAVGSWPAMASIRNSTGSARRKFTSSLRTTESGSTSRGK